MASTPRSARIRVSSTSSHASSSRPPRESRTSSALPMAVLLRARRARRRARRPRAEAGRSRVGSSSTRSVVVDLGLGRAGRRGRRKGVDAPTVGVAVEVGRRGGRRRGLRRWWRRRQLLLARRPPANQPDDARHEDDGDDGADGNDLPDLVEHGAHPCTVGGTARTPVRAEPPRNPDVSRRLAARLSRTTRRSGEPRRGRASAFGGVPARRPLRRGPSAARDRPFGPVPPRHRRPPCLRRGRPTCRRPRRTCDQCDAM